MSKGGNTHIAETGTPASRVLFINSGDATTTFNNNTSNFMFSLEEAVIVPNHHSIMLSLIGAEIPYSFYNFIQGRNTRLDYYHSQSGTPAFYNANGNMAAGGTGAFYTLTLPPGNWNAVELANYLTNEINSWAAEKLVIIGNKRDSKKVIAATKARKAGKNLSAKFAKPKVKLRMITLRKTKLTRNEICEKLAKEFKLSYAYLIKIWSEEFGK